MLVSPASPPRRPQRRDRNRRDFTFRSDLGATILRMISTQSLPAFTPAIDRTAPAKPPREAGLPAPTGLVEAVAAPAAAQRSLDAVPAQPSRPVPRGSLLDLRV